MTKKQHQYEHKWVGEVNKKLGYKILFKPTKIIFEGKSKYSHIILAETKELGKILLLGEDDYHTLQFSENYPIYDEMLANVPMNSHPNPQKVLIIGGGDGAVLYNVLKYDEVKEVTLVEIDKMVIEVSKKHFKHAKVFEDPRVKIVIEDGAKFLEETKEKFDIIIGDYTDPYQGTPAETLIKKEFYRNAREKLKDDGIIAVQAGSPIYQKEITNEIYKRLKEAFENVAIYFSPSPIYPGGIWVYCIASLSEFDFMPIREIKGGVYYSPDTHRSSFSLPPFIESIIR